MGKRSEFKRLPRDSYFTPYEAVVPLLPFISGTFCEPCAGDGRLINHLEKHGMKCSAAYDIDPQAPGIIKANTLDLFSVGRSDFIVTNPPWRREMMHPMIRHFSRLAPTWLLFDADWAHTVQAAPFLACCAKIVSVGRVQWIADSDSTGMDNCCWYNFVDHEVETVFHGRKEKKTCEKTLEIFS